MRLNQSSQQKCSTLVAIKNAKYTPSEQIANGNIIRIHSSPLTNRPEQCNNTSQIVAQITL